MYQHEKDLFFPRNLIQMYFFMLLKQNSKISNICILKSEETLFLSMF